MKQYRTQEQYQTMVENMLNGNWTDAATNAVEFGWWADDIWNYLYENIDCLQPEEIFDWAILCETAQKIRAERKLI